jgi:hypothetical protein
MGVTDWGQRAVGTPESFIEMVWGSHAGEPARWFEVQSRKQNRKPPDTYEEASRRWFEDDSRFFAPVPRKTAGNRREDCVDEHDLLWVDVDGQEAVNPDQALARVHTATEKLGIFPLAIVYSGRAGAHLYWKLDRCLSIDQIQGLNKALAIALDGDRACWNCNRILRIPGTRNEKSGGGKAKLLHLDPEPIGVGALGVLGEVTPIPLIRSTRTIGPTSSLEPEWLRLSHDYDHWGERDPRLGAALTNMQINFLYRRRDHGWSDRRHRSRSEMEMTIAYRLISKGWSDEQIKELADAGFPHHVEWMAEHPDRPDAYIDQTLANAREELFERRRLVTSPLGGNPRKAYPKKRPRRFGEFPEIHGLARGQKKSELVTEAARKLRRSRATIYRRIAKLEEHGLVETRSGRIFQKGR